MTSQQPVKSANGVPMDAAWARYVTNTIIGILARDKGWEITKRVLTPKEGVTDNT